MTLFLMSGLTIGASAQNADTDEFVPSMCQAIAANKPLLGWPGQFQSAQLPLRLAQSESGNLSQYDVSITYVTHSTFRIETHSGLIIATDFSGYAGRDVIPDVVTMNHAHSTHYTIAPDPRIAHVLPGWGEDGAPANHRLQIADALIRNVTTNIHNDWVGFERDGNSIFIFEVAGLCIGHLGHLHHILTDAHYAQIGRLDVLMVPVDGGMTLDVKSMSIVAKRLRSSIVLPMHWFGRHSLERFINEIKTEFQINRSEGSSMVVSLRSLPSLPTLTVLEPELRTDPYDLD